MIAAKALTVAALSQMDQAAFVASLGHLFEHSPWVAEGAWPQRPFKDAATLHAAMMGVVRGRPLAQQIAFLNQHPELAGKEAQAGTMTGHSTHEQQGLNALSRDELQELQRLNATYARRHGFPFIISALGHDKAQICAALRERTERETDEEVAEALAQVASITRRRLQALLAGA